LTVTGPTLDLPEVAKDPLKFKDDKPYTSRLAAARKKTGREDAMAIGRRRDQIGVRDHRSGPGFLPSWAARWAWAQAKPSSRLANAAVESRTPLVAFTAAGGARMQEGALSLMQMPRTTLGVQDAQRGGPALYRGPHRPDHGRRDRVLRHAGRCADFRTGRPDRLCRPRVIEQTIREKLPEGFQRAEYLAGKGHG
jgi:acetyl-CoA carboxylase carboxyl transferase subunit beta